jgi:hypothetical protein
VISDTYADKDELLLLLLLLLLLFLLLLLLLLLLLYFVILLSVVALTPGINIWSRNGNYGIIISFFFCTDPSVPIIVQLNFFEGIDNTVDHYHTIKIYTNAEKADRTTDVKIYHVLGRLQGTLEKFEFFPIKCRVQRSLDLFRIAQENVLNASSKALNTKVRLTAKH